MSILHWVKFLNKGLDEEEDKKEGLLKRLKNIEDKNEELLKKAKIKTENIKEVTDFNEEPLSLEGKTLMEDEFDSKLAALRYYTPKVEKYIEAKNKILDNAKKFYEGREKIIKGFKNGILLLNHDDEFEEQQTSEKFNEKELPIKPTKLGRQELEIIKKKKTT